MHKYKYCNNKVDLLWKRKNRIEAVLFMGFMIEFFIKETIGTFEKIIEGSVLAYKVGFNPSNLYRKDIEKQPLGFLITVLDSYTKDKRIIKKLRNFSEIRNKCVHGLFGQKLVKLNKELKSFNLFYYKLLFDLMKLDTRLLDVANKSFYSICDDCHKKAIKKVVKY